MTEPNPIVIGTRGSELALVQAEATAAALRALHPEFAIDRRIIKTTGDRRTDVSLAEVAKAEGIFDKGVFIKELEHALAAGEIDIAVHSLKDMPTVLDEPFQLAAVLERAPVRDVLVTRDGGDFDSLPHGARIGTSSVRRARQSLFLRPDLEILDIRGNVPTRLRKLAEGDAYDAVLLAEAGLVRLGFLPAENPDPDAAETIAGFENLHAMRLPEDLFLPAGGQGAIGLEVRAGDERALSTARSINHRETWLRITAEREFLRLLDAGCHTPVGVFSSITGDELTLKTRVFPEGDGAPRVAEASGTDPAHAALTLYQNLS